MKMNSNLINVLARGSQSLFKQLIFLVPIYFYSQNSNPESFGEIAYVLGVTSIFVMIADFGISAIVLREVVNYKRSLNSYINSIVIFGSLTSLILSLILLQLIEVKYTDKILISLITALHFFYVVTDSILRARNSFVKLLLLTFMSFLAYVSVFLIYNEQNILLPVLLFYTTYMTSALFSGVLSFKHCRISFSFYKDIVFKACPILISTLLFIFIFRIDLFYINEYLAKEDIGTYEYLDKVFNLFVFAVVIVAQVFVVKIINIGEYNALRIFRDKVVGFSVLLLLYSIVYFYFYKLPFSSFELELSLIIISSLILPLRIINVIFIQSYAYAFGYEKIVIIVNLIAALINIAFNFLLVNDFGLNGILAATLLANLISSILFSLFVLRKIYA